MAPFGSVRVIRSISESAPEFGAPAGGCCYRTTCGVAREHFTGAPAPSLMLDRFAWQQGRSLLPIVPCRMFFRARSVRSPVSTRQFRIDNLSMGHVIRVRVYGASGGDTGHYDISAANVGHRLLRWTGPADQRFGRISTDCEASRYWSWSRSTAASPAVPGDSLASMSFSSCRDI